MMFLVLFKQCWFRFSNVFTNFISSWIPFLSTPFNMFLFEVGPLLKSTTPSMYFWDSKRFENQKLSEHFLVKYECVGLGETDSACAEVLYAMSFSDVKSLRLPSASFCTSSCHCVVKLWFHIYVKPGGPPDSVPQPERAVCQGPGFPMLPYRTNRLPPCLLHLFFGDNAVACQPSLGILPAHPGFLFHTLVLGASADGPYPFFILFVVHSSNSDDSS